MNRERDQPLPAAGSKASLKTVIRVTKSSQMIGAKDEKQKRLGRTDKGKTDGANGSKSFFNKAWEAASSTFQPGSQKEQQQPGPRKPETKTGWLKSILRTRNRKKVAMEGEDPIDGSEVKLQTPRCYFNPCSLCCIPSVRTDTRKGCLWVVINELCLGILFTIIAAVHFLRYQTILPEYVRTAERDLVAPVVSLITDATVTGIAAGVLMVIASLCLGLGILFPSAIASFLSALLICGSLVPLWLCALNIVYGMQAVTKILDRQLFPPSEKREYTHSIHFYITLTMIIACFRTLIGTYEFFCGVGLALQLRAGLYKAHVQALPHKSPNAPDESDQQMTSRMPAYPPFMITSVLGSEDPVIIPLNFGPTVSNGIEGQGQGQGQGQYGFDWPANVTVANFNRRCPHCQTQF